MWDLWNWKPYTLSVDRNYTLKCGPKGSLAANGTPLRVTTRRRFRWAFAPCSVARGSGWRALCGGFFWRRAKVALAGLAGTNFAQMFEAENSCSVAVGKLDLHGVVSHRVGALGGDARFVHAQQERGRTGAALGFLLALVVAQRAGAMIAQVREIVAAGVLVRPSDLHALARRDVYLNAHRFFSRVLCYGHWKFSLRLGNLLLASVPRPKRREFPPSRSP